MSSDTELIGLIVLAIKNDPKFVRALANLHTPSSDYCVWTLSKKVLRLVPSGWEQGYAKFAECVRVLSGNWSLSIPELLDQLSEHDISIDQFFKIERDATFKLTALLNDINVIQKEIAPDQKMDISSYIAKLSKAFLPSCVMELEEYGLPRMLAKKIHASGLINFEDENLDLHTAIDLLRNLKPEILVKVKGLASFDSYVLDYFFDGIALQQPRAVEAPAQ